MTDLEGNEVNVLGATGKGPHYRYLGAARFLPGVKEVFNKPPEVQKRRSRYDIYKRIDASYYGYRDDEDGTLVKVERPTEEDMQARVLREWQRIESVKREARMTVKSGEITAVNPILFEEEEDVAEEMGEQDKGNDQQKEHDFVAHVPLPDEKEIERMVVEKKKQELLSKYTSEDLLVEQVKAKAMLNIQR